jgi:hypothetical protein
MKPLIWTTVLSAALLALPGVHAQQTDRPAGATGQCKDGSYTSQASKRGACRGHQGVKAWYAAAGAAAAATTPPATAHHDKAGARRSMAWTQPAAKAAPGGGAGKVWVNDGSKVYHCQGDKWYGRTKHGKYLPESDAKAKGYHGPRGKDCSA